MNANERVTAFVDEGLGHASYLVDLGGGRALVIDPPRIPTARNIFTDRRRQVIETTKSPEPLVFGLHEAPPLPKLPASVKPSAETNSTAADSKTKLARAGIDAATFLRSPAELRNAIVLREIFGPPRSLQPFDLIGSA